VLFELEELGYRTQPFAVPACAFDAPHIRQRVWIVAYRAEHGRGSGRAWRSDSSGERERERSLQAVAHADAERRHGRTGSSGERRRGEFADGYRWPTEPDVGRVAHGVPNRVDRLRGLGNAVVPQIVEWFGRMILEAHGTPSTVG
jgi:DNA (cytosine-5)-methyltransferase 1